MQTRTANPTPCRPRVRRARAAALIAAAGVLLGSASAARAGTYYVNPKHPSASDGDQYYCNPRTSCTEENRVALLYGTRDKPFGSLREGVYQVKTYAPGAHTIYVAPGLYRENVYMAGVDGLHIVADTLGTATGSTPGEVVVTGAEPLDEAGFVPDPDPLHTDVWVLYGALRPDGFSLCLTQDDRPPGLPCDFSTVVEAGNPDPDLRRRRYDRKSSAAEVALGPGRFFADIDQSDFNLPVDLYVRTHGSGKPTPSLELEYVINQFGGSDAYDIFFRHRHCFDMELGAEGNVIEGFTCRYTSSYGIHAAMGSNTIRRNLVYGSNSAGIRIGGDSDGTSDAIVEANEVSHSNFGIRVEQRETDTFVENNVMHSNSGEGVLVEIAAQGSGGPAGVFLGNNTLHGNDKNLVVTGVGDLVAVNNSLSDATFTQYDVMAGGGAMDHNNVSGAIGPGPSSVPVSNEDSLAPSYRDAAGFDFRLDAGSDLIDAGTSLPVAGFTPPADDGDGAVRVPPSDVGAFEYGPCGDGVVAPGVGEQCDDGNRRSRDGCDAACQIEPLYVFEGPLYATDASCDCAYTVDKAGIRKELQTINAAAPTSMAVTPSRRLVMEDGQTGRLLTWDPATGKKRTICAGLPVVQSLAVSPVDLPGPGRTWPAGTLFGAERQLYAINPKNCRTLMLGPIGPTGTEVIGGLDFDADGTLFGAQSSSSPALPESLFRIDTRTGRGAAVGPSLPAFGQVGSLAFDGNGVLWISDVDPASPGLLRLDPGNASIIHRIFLPALGPGQPASPQGLGLLRP